MRLHDLRPADGSRKERTRVGRGIAAGKGKTAGRGTKGQKARSGGSIPPWFEGGQTPLHMRIPKLRGFKNRFKIEYEIVNVGAIAAAAERGAFETEAADAKPTARTKAAPQITVNQDILRAVGLVRSLNKPLKILGAGELSIPLFVVADAFTASARAKIEGAGGTVNVLEVPTSPLKAIGLDADEGPAPATPPRGRRAAKAEAAEKAQAAEDAPARQAEAPTTDDEAPTAESDDSVGPDTEPDATAKPARASRAKRAARAETAEPESTAEAEPTSEGTEATGETGETGETGNEAETASGDDA
jgi:large subunit ribosomal protein L15